jgi:hypothetical protein
MMQDKLLHRAAAFFAMILLLLCSSSCLRYSFTGASIPEGVNSIFIPFFADQSSGEVADLSDRLNQVLIDRFINQSQLQLADSRAGADAVLEGAIVSYGNAPFSVTGEEQADQNQVSISVRGTFEFTEKEESEWNKSFNGSATYDPNDDPIEGENTAAQQALEQIANNMFNDAVSGW